MNAFRKISVVSLIVLVALAISLSASSAHAGGGCYTPKYCGSYSSCCSYPSYNYCSYPSYNYCSYPSYNYCNYGYNYCNFTPATYCFPQQYCYPQQYCFPVTTYDCYGRPTVVWQTSGGQGVYNASFGGAKLVQ